MKKPEKPADKERRQPTLADRFVAHRYPARDRYLARGYLDDMQRKTRIARKFVFDEAAITRVAHVVRDIPELLVREYAFARAPFDVTWIEFPHWKYWRELGHDASLQDDEADHSIGYLIDHNVVSVIAGGTVGDPSLGPYPTVLQFHLNTEWPPEMARDFAGFANADLDVLDQFLWGSTYNHLDAETRTLLRRHNAVLPTPCDSTVQANAARRKLQLAFKGGAGELRTVIALLLMLNRPTITRYSNIEPGRGWIKGKHHAFMAHTSVAIDLDAVPTMRLLGTAEGEGVPRRRHEVRGHYCHDREARDYLRIAGCIHDWRSCDEEWTPNDAEISDANHWVCATCGGKRWWRAEHERGDASIGYVSHDDYRVTAR